MRERIRIDSIIDRATTLVSKIELNTIGTKTGLSMIDTKIDLSTFDTKTNLNRIDTNTAVVTAAIMTEKDQLSTITLKKLIPHRLLIIRTLRGTMKNGDRSQNEVIMICLIRQPLEMYSTTVRDRTIIKSKFTLPSFS